ncbi:cystathionine beta-lyase [Neorhizobium lilium]|uniref:Cystathionine beta-lyase n=1 Tax=Neorhizobium lilium TaxID=2503024 RepID=A0A444LM57_9HYPH|nr:PLP-dependent transferase [Neorhizobium lilium]RWX81437.1 cystathionine beta-lyase [Neorhizobium lilium]
MHDSTRCVHRPEVSLEGFDSLSVPTYRASTIVYPNTESFSRRKERGADGYAYGLYGTPTTRTLEAQITALHHGVRTHLVPSGLAAVTMPMIALLGPGDEVMIPDTVYGPVRAFCADFLAQRGIHHRVYDPLIGGRIGDLIKGNTRLVWVESPGSGSMEVQDLPAIAREAKARGALVGCDNTWASPLLCKPLDLGADIVAEALTKYVGGHSDLLLGSITVRDMELRTRIRDVLRLLGIGVSPDEAALALRGIETMSVRLRHIGGVAERLAHRLREHPAAMKVLHPALPECPGHEHWVRDFQGASGVFSVALKPEALERLDDALGQLSIFAIGASWGGTRSLIAPLSLGSERSITSASTLAGPVVRISVGVEDEEDIQNDLQVFFDSLLHDPASRGPLVIRC